MSQILDGKKVAQKLKDGLKIEIEDIKSKFNRVPGLAVVQIGNVAASSVYVKAKTKAAKEVGINVFDHHLVETTNQNDLINLINQLNNNEEVDGILVQLPLPNTINEEAVFNVLPDHDLGGIALDTRTKLREHFLEMEIANQTIDNYIKNDTLNTINVKIELATHKENSQVNERDKNSMNKFLQKLQEDAMNDLTTRFGSQEGSQAYLDTAASKKTLRKRMDDAVVDKVNVLVLALNWN